MMAVHWWISCLCSIFLTSHVSAQVNGGWGPWGDWLPLNCPVTCGGAQSLGSQSRECNNPAPSGGGAACMGESFMISSGTCGDEPCPVDGVWTEWSQWIGACSHACGGGTLLRNRTRQCINPAPRFGGAPCPGPDTEIVTAVCNTDPCKVDGSWSPWTQWTDGTCSRTCGGGTLVRNRTRACINPAPSNGGLSCLGTDTQTEMQDCNTQSCSVHGGWSRWSEWSASSCSVTCGAGSSVKSRRRLCDNPPPMNDGNDCPGIGTETTAVGDCNRDSCSVSPIDGNWGFWSQWSGTLCPVTCGGGRYTRERNRACDSPAPSNGGADCADPTSYVQRENPTCNENPCPINGGFGQWASWTSACSTSCGIGILMERKTRLCNNPAPQNGGRICEGALVQNVTKECNLGDCSGRFGFTAIIVLDGSESIGDSNFQTIKSALHTVAQQALSQNGLIKIGVVVFSDKVTQVISATSDVESLVTDIGNIAYPDGGTSTNLGIEAARQLLLQEHSDGKYIFLLTDGLSNLPEVTRRSADQAKTDGITILVLGVTQAVETFPEYKAQFDKEMNDIASPGFVFTSETFDSILSVTASIVQNLFDSALWSTWGPWSDAPCPVTCGTEAVRPSTRTRTCLSGSQPTSDCRGPTSEERHLSCGLSSGCPGRGHYTYVIVGVVCGAVVLLVLVVFVVFIYKIRSSDGIEKSPHSAYTVPDKTSGSYDNHVYSQMDEKPPGLKSVDSQYHEYTQPVEGLTPTDRNNGYIDILDDQSQVVRM